MPQAWPLTMDERNQIEALIRKFDGHGCGLGLDLEAQAALRRLLDALDEAEKVVEQYQPMNLERTDTADGPVS
jgi:hypothetical protein